MDLLIKKILIIFVIEIKYIKIINSYEKFIVNLKGITLIKQDVIP